MEALSFTVTNVAHRFASIVPQADPECRGGRRAAPSDRFSGAWWRKSDVALPRCTGAWPPPRSPETVM